LNFATVEYSINAYIRYMRNWSFLLFFWVPAILFGQENISLKNKYFGKYKGTIAAYKIQSDKAILEVGASAIYIDIAEDVIDVKIGNLQMHGTYRVLFKTKNYYLLEARMEGESYAERIKIYVKGGRAEREGLYPQPNVELEKI